MDTVFIDEIMLEHDGVTCSLAHFLHVNTADDVGQIDTTEIAQLIQIQVGESCNVGMSIVTRVQ